MERLNGSETKFLIPGHLEPMHMVGSLRVWTNEKRLKFINW